MTQVLKQVHVYHTVPEDLKRKVWGTMWGQCLDTCQAAVTPRISTVKSCRQ